MNKLNIKNLLTAIQNMIMRNRVAYKDYLGKETVVKPVLLASGLSFSGQPSVSFELIEGQSYDIDFGDERITLTARLRGCADNMPEDVSSWVSITPELDNFPDGYLLSEDPSTLPDDSFSIQIHDGLMFTSSTGKYADKDFDLYRNDLVTTNKYDIKLLPEELLPKSVAKKKDVDKVAQTFGATTNNIQSNISGLKNQYVRIYSQSFTDDEKAQARENIGASDFSGNFGDLADAPLKYEKTRTLTYDFSTDRDVFSYRYNIKDDPRGTVFVQANIVDITTLIAGATVQIVLPYTGDNYWASQESIVKTIAGSDGTTFRYAGNLSLMWATSIFDTQELEGFPDDSYPAYSEIYKKDTGEDFILIVSGDPNPSYFFASTHNIGGSRKVYIIAEEIQPLDDRLLADNIQRVGSDLIINSSTEGSTKKFKLVVDDSGEVSATEVAG